MNTFPSTLLFQDIGNVYVAEFNMEDGCEKVRRLPHFIITEPIRKKVPVQTCIPDAYILTEWSTSYQSFHDSGAFVTCPDHSISIRVTYGPGFDLATLKANINKLIDSFTVTGGLAELNNRIDNP